MEKKLKDQKILFMIYSGRDGSMNIITERQWSNASFENIQPTACHIVHTEYMLFQSEFETQIKFPESKSISHSSLTNELLTQCLEHGSCAKNVGLINEPKIEKACKGL